MNWLGAGLGSLVAALFGATLGALVHVEARRHGVDAPLIVGLFAGLAAALASQRKSLTRGVLVGSLSVWGAALAEVLAEPSRGALEDVAAFHERLGPARALLFVATLALAAALASRAWAAPVLARSGSGPRSPDAGARPLGRRIAGELREDAPAEP